MHETGIAAELLRMAEAAAGQPSPGGVLRVGVTVGALSGVVPEALEFAFDALKTECPALRNATLSVEFRPVRALCAACGAQHCFDHALALWCPECGAKLEVLQGLELDLAWVEVATEGALACNESP